MSSSPASMAGLPGSSRQVNVGPPLSCSGPRCALGGGVGLAGRIVLQRTKVRIEGCGFRTRLITTAGKTAAAIRDADEIMAKRTEPATGVGSRCPGRNAVVTDKCVQQTECRRIAQVRDAPAPPVCGRIYGEPDTDIPGRI